MYDKGLSLDALAAAARTGEPEAVAAYQRNLEPQMRLMVRRVVRTGSRGTTLSRRILAEIARTVPPGWRPAGPDEEKVILLVARRLSAQYADEVQTQRALSSRETVFC